MQHQFNYLVALVALGLCYFSGSIEGATIDKSYGYYRLPTSIKPYRYKLKVLTHLEDPSNLTFNGQVDIRFNVLQDTQNITLHSQNLLIDESKIKIKSYKDDQKIDCLLSVSQVPEQDYFIIQLCQTLRKGQAYKLRLFFSGVLSEKLHGYYRSSYVEKATNKTKWLSITQFEPAYARAAFPCFDEPEYKAKFYIWLGHHKFLTGLSNMPMVKQVKVNSTKDFVWSIFEESVPMSTYLVAYSVNDFSYKKSDSIMSSNEVEFRTWARPEAIDQVQFAGEVGPKVLKYYEEIFGIPFPLPKIDQIAIPDFSAGAMENWGLVTYRETALLFAPDVSSSSNILRIAQVIAHELAHQWFGNLVTMKWWSDLWLNEGFATYIASLGIENLYPDWQSYNEESLENTLNIFRRDAQLSSHPISLPILNTNQIAERFDSISYKKGSAVLRMLHLVLEDEAFYAGVRDYLNKHRYGNAEQDDLWAVFTDKAHQYNRINPKHKMKDIMDSWTLQTGYPLVKVERNYETNLVDISQQRFFENKTLAEQHRDKPECWWVPLSYTIGMSIDFQKTRPQFWLECDENGKSKPLEVACAAKNEWVIFNLQLAGVYRVMYDRENLRLLNKTLNSKDFTKIHVMNRAQLLDDAIWLAWSGYYEYDITLDFLEYLREERAYLPWRAALDGLNGVNRLLKPLVAEYEFFKRYMRYLITPVYQHLTANNESIQLSSFTKRLHQALIASWACRLDINDCVSSAISSFNKWKATKDPKTENTIPVDLRSTVYCTAIRHGTDEDWQFLWQRYKESNVATEQQTFIFALACSRNTKTLSDYVKMTFEKNSSIREQDSTFVFGAVARNEIGFPIAKQYFIENIDKLIEFYSGYPYDMAYLISPMAGLISSVKDRNKLRSLIDARKDFFKQIERSMASSFETIDFNIQWVNHNRQMISSRLQSRLNILDG